MKVCIPELELELGHGTLGGVFTTVEGLLNKVHTGLHESNPFAIGDSGSKHHSERNETSEVKVRFQTFMDKLQGLAQGRSFPFSIVLRDPLGNSFVSARLGSFTPVRWHPFIYLPSHLLYKYV